MNAVVVGKATCKCMMLETQRIRKARGHGSPPLLRFVVTAHGSAPTAILKPLFDEDDDDAQVNFLAQG